LSPQVYAADAGQPGDAVIALAAGARHCVALTAGGDVLTWGMGSQVCVSLVGWFVSMFFNAFSSFQPCLPFGCSLSSRGLCLKMMKFSSTLILLSAAFLPFAPCCGFAPFGSMLWLQGQLGRVAAYNAEHPPAAADLVTPSRVELPEHWTPEGDGILAVCTGKKSSTA
jgi:hypothetical protein